MSSKDADRIADTADLDQIYTVFDLSLHMINIMNCKVNRHRINTGPKWESLICLPTKLKLKRICKSLPCVQGFSKGIRQKYMTCTT